MAAHESGWTEGERRDIVRHGLARRMGGLGRAVVIVLTALAGSQLAAFISAYEQNLAGRLAEAERDVAGVVERARQAGRPLHAYLEAFRTAGDPVFVREGGAIQAKIDRAAFLADDLGALDRAGVIGKPIVFFARLDGAIARSAWRRFDPAVPVGAVGLIYTGAGLLIGLLVAELLAALGRGCRRALRRRPAPR